MPREKLLTEDIARGVYEVYMREGPAMAQRVCRCEKFGRSTYYKIISSEGRVINTPHTGRKKAWSSDQVDKLVDYIEEYPASTLKEIREHFMGLGFPDVTIQTISNYLDGRLITYKKACLVTDARDSEVVHVKRREYIKWLSTEHRRTMIYVDESGFNLWTARGKGRAAKGETPRVLVSSQKCCNRSICMAVSGRYGIIHDKMIIGAYNGESFDKFLEELVGKIHDLRVVNPVIVLDNCRIHRPESMEKLREHGVEFKFLPPWSPMFNPIEEVFNDLKREIKTLITMNYRDELLEIAMIETREKGLKRGLMFEKIYKEAATKITPILVQSHELHLISVFGDAVLGHNV